MSTLNEQTFSEELLIANKYVGSTSLVIKEMQVEIALRCHPTQETTAVIRKSRNKCWQGCRDGISVETPLFEESPPEPATSPLSIFPKERDIVPQGLTHTRLQQRSS